MKLTIILFILTHSISSFASALVKKDSNNKTLTVIARMVYFGKAMTEDLAQSSTDEIHRMWNEYPSQVLLQGEYYKVSFEIDYIFGRENLSQTESCAHNYIEIRNLEFDDDVSYYEKIGGNKGYFYTSDDLGNSTTAAHEFGHALGVTHDRKDQMHATVPGIMAARGALVRSEFQLNPNARIGSKGRTLNPIHRRVRTEDIQRIPFTKVKFNNDNLGCLGSGNIEEII